MIICFPSPLFLSGSSTFLSVNPAVLPVTQRLLSGDDLLPSVSAISIRLLDIFIRRSLCSFHRSKLLSGGDFLLSVDAISIRLLDIFIRQSRCSFCRSETPIRRQSLTFRRFIALPSLSLLYLSLRPFYPSLLRNLPKRKQPFFQTAAFIL